MALPPQFAIQTGLPSSVIATLNATAQSKVIAETPLRSHHEGHMSLVVTDPSAKQTFVNIEITVKGDSDGSPTEGIGQALNNFLDSASLMARPIPQSNGANAK